jgi:predicted lipoprotein with Yx(FWY)xxD motif
MFKLRTGAVLAMIAIGLAFSGCGSDDQATTAAAEGGAASTRPKPTQVSTGVPSGRPVLVSEIGETLYAFENDPMGGPPECNGKCAKEWLPLLTTSQPVPYPSATAIKPALLGTVERKGGSLQETYAGHPLYEYADDAPADTRGSLVEEFGGTWHLILPDGKLVSGVATVSTGKVDGLGTVLVDSKGHTLYDFHMDKGAPTSTCYGICTDVWPPLYTEGRPKAEGAVKKSLLGTTEREDGLVQVTYAGHPLYTYVDDKAPGENHGEDPRIPEAEWYGWALKPNGKEAAPGDPRVGR